MVQSTEDQDLPSQGPEDKTPNKNEDQGPIQGEGTSEGLGPFEQKRSLLKHINGILMFI